MVYQSSHCNLILSQNLRLRVFDKVIMRCQYIIYVDFLYKFICLNITYPLCQILDQNTNGLNIFRLISIAHHHLHMFFHFGKVRLCCQDSNHQKIFKLKVLHVIKLDFGCLLEAFFLSFLNVSEEKWCFNHIQNVKVFVHIYFDFIPI